MKIELKGIKFYQSMSDETNCFEGYLYVDGKKCGYVRNDGRGGNTFISPIDVKTRDLFNECEKYCKSLPKYKLTFDNEDHYYDNNIEYVVDDLFEKWLEEKETKKLEKKMVNHIMWGIPNGYSYTSVKFIKPLNQIDRSLLQKYLDKYKKEFKEGEKFLNTNLVGFDL